MRLEQLHYLVAVTRQGSLRRAAEELHISQPALSEALTKLEHELGVTLLDRSRRGARLSTAGTNLIDEMTEVLEAADRLRSTASSLSHGTTPIRMGTVTTALSSVLAPALGRFGAEHPQTPVEMITSDPAALDRGLLEGSLDLGLVNLLEGDLAREGLVDLDLTRGQAVAVMHRDHPLASAERVAAEDLERELLITMRAGHVMHRFVRGVVGEPERRHVVDGAESGKALVACGSGVTVLPDYSVTGDPRVGHCLAVVPIEAEATGVRLVLRRRAAHRDRPVVGALITALREASRRSDRPE